MRYCWSVRKTGVCMREQRSTVRKVTIRLHPFGHINKTVVTQRIGFLYLCLFVCLFNSGYTASNATRQQTPRRRALEKLLVKKLPAFYATRRFITVFTTAFHLTLSSARCIQFTPAHPIYMRCISILFSQMCPDPPYSSLPTKTLHVSLFSTICTTRPVRLFLFDFIIRIIFGDEHKS